MAIRATDGNPLGFSLTGKPGAADTDTEFVFKLPAPTTFDRFAVPNVLETPSPTQTFTRQVEVYGSAAGPDKGFVLLGSGTLATHKARGQVTELAVRAKTPVRWVKLRLVGGIQVTTSEAFFEFSEIIGNGAQEVPGLATHFNGLWKGKGVLIQLKQEGPVVSGCYGTSGELTGTVTGNILRATGAEGPARTKSAFLLTVAENGTLLGVRSTNGGPFALYTGDAAPENTAVKCRAPATVSLGCGSIIHGIHFDFDSAAIRPDSAPVLVTLFKGLSSDRSAAIVIEGHTSNEGTNDYNQSLSERRAQAIVDDLVKRGIEPKRLKAAGLGETRPIAPNADESGRELNRRVEVKCRQDP
jgi:OmpA-OmpF porin, OOP family